MKKSALIKWIPLCLLILSAISLISTAGAAINPDALAATTPANPNTQITADPSSQNPNEIIAAQFGINPDKLDVGEIRRNYLAKEWGQIVANMSYIGPVHKFFMAHQTYFAIIFGVPYEMSLTFFLVAILWIFVAWNTRKMFNASGIVSNKWLNATLGVLFAIAVAQSGLFKAIVNFVLNIIFRQENVWLRAILWVIVFVVLILAQYLAKFGSKWLADRKKAKDAAAVKLAGDELKETAGGIKQVRESAK